MSQISRYDRTNATFRAARRLTHYMFQSRTSVAPNTFAVGKFPSQVKQHMLENSTAAWTTQTLFIWGGRGGQVISCAILKEGISLFVRRVFICQMPDLHQVSDRLLPLRQKFNPKSHSIPQPCRAQLGTGGCKPVIVSVAAGPTGIPLRT